ncbi:dystrophin, isoforms A/C/F/G/H isoform X2 [Mugil cephalus]|uniref:dystrophin, isoforms A/C/F/G/H isoform X2 n=1 Tax=Mugil cephalus TaxID=48193 RepID=UPI001FB7331E|nr:dystrophin, isoforms A/C/F/G/H isoform X2 [Mugil cephalus]
MAEYSWPCWRSCLGANWLNNISKALAFLDDRHVRLFGIDASGIADGTPSVVLNLAWNIILHFQVKEVTRGLQRHLSSSLSSLSVGSYPSCDDLSPQSDDPDSYSCNTLPSKGRKASREPKYHGKAINTLLQWVQRCTSKYGVDVTDFGKGWRSGLAFLAMIKSINPDLVDLWDSLSREPKENIQQAFIIAHQSLDVPPLLEPEDVICASPDERSIITYVSMFLGHISGVDEGHTTETEVPHIHSFGLLESVRFGETLADDPQAQALLKSLGKSSEQLLWKRWSRRSSGSPSTTFLPTNTVVTSSFSSNSSSQSITDQRTANDAILVFNKKKGRCRSVFQPPSPLDTGVVSKEIQSWMEKGLDRSYSNRRVDESYFSISSEEGIYTLSALDSDEEDAYSYILDLNKEVFQTYSQFKNNVPKVEEETAEEMNEELKHLEASEMFIGDECKHKEGFLPSNSDFELESNVRAQSVIYSEFDLDKNKSSLTEMINNRDDLEPVGSGCKEGFEEDNVVRRHSNDNGSYCEEERGKRLQDARKDEYDTRENDAKTVEASEKRRVQEDLRKFEEGQDLRKEGYVKEEEKRNLKNVMLESFKVEINGKVLVERISAARINAEEYGWGDNVAKRHLTKTGRDEEKMGNTAEAHSESYETPDGKDRELLFRKHKDLTTIGRPIETSKVHDTDGGDHIHDDDQSWIPACGATSQSFSGEGFLLQSLASSCDLTPLELQMLLVLWILLYCCLILSQMNP